MMIDISNRFRIHYIWYMEEKEKKIINPIDKDKITETPSTLEYAHTVGGVVVKPEDVGKLKGRALSAMEHQTDQQLLQIKEQMQLLAEQAKRIQHRKEVSERIYEAAMRFEPLINHTYHIYEKEDGTNQLSMIAPNQWGRSKNNWKFIATAKLLADHTWEIIE